MKPSPILMTTIALLAVGAIQAKAQIITSIQFGQSSFTGTAELTSSQVAGEDPVSFWNVLDPVYPSIPGGGGIAQSNGSSYTDTITAGSLVTSTDASSSIGYTLTSGGAHRSSTNLSSPNSSLQLSGGAATYGATGAKYNGGVTLTLNGLNAGDTYSFLLYVSGTNGDASGSSLSLSTGGTQYFTWNSGLSSWVNNSSSTNNLSTLTSGTVSTDYANYVLFSGITGVTTETVTLTEQGDYSTGSFAPSSSNIVQLNGVQVLDTPAAVVPEPSTGWLLALAGFVGFIYNQRRRSRQF